MHPQMASRKVTVVFSDDLIDALDSAARRARRATDNFVARSTLIHAIIAKSLPMLDTIARECAEEKGK